MCTTISSPTRIKNSEPENSFTLVCVPKQSCILSKAREEEEKMWTKEEIRKLHKEISWIKRRYISPYLVRFRWHWCIAEGNRSAPWTRKILRGNYFFHPLKGNFFIRFVSSILFFSLTFFITFFSIFKLVSFTLKSKMRLSIKYWFYFFLIFILFLYIFT